MVEKIIHSVQFQKPYTNSVEQKPEIIDIVETNYKIARISFLTKSASIQNTKNMEREREDRGNAYKINNSVSFFPKADNPLDVVIGILNDDIDHRKTTHRYMPPQVQTAPTIELETQAIDNEFVKLKEQFDRVGNVAAEQKKQKETA